MLRRHVRKKKPKKPNDRAPIVECVLCTKRYSMADILGGRFWVETLICSPCYAKMQAAPFHESCFGKPSEIRPDGKRYGYTRTSKACLEWCPDRLICRRIVNPPPV